MALGVGAELRRGSGARPAEARARGLGRSPTRTGDIRFGARRAALPEPTPVLGASPSVLLSPDPSPAVPAGAEPASWPGSPDVFAYDHCFWSMDESVRDKYAGQDDVFKCLGENILQNAFDGYNACIFAYGQTGSGKSYTMMGTAEQPGLIPRLCSGLFARTQREENEEQSFKVEVSYMEIYNEKVRDLLDPKGSRQTLKVREHSVLGPYVDGLSKLAVRSYKDIESLMSEGNKSRTVAATNMNEESSRSHAVFKITLTHTLHDVKSGTSGEKVGKLSLVDLAGSERATKTGAAGDRLKEGSNINRSLTTLGLVISALADQGAGKSKNKFVPYRDSVLTWLLKDSLGGNSKTAMVATVSPAADNYDETLSTLRYADRAKNIVNHAVVNEDPNARIIRDLREEVEKLREQLTKAEAMKSPELKDRLEESEKLIQEMTVTWEEKLRKTEEIAQERQKQLESLGVSLQSSGIKVGDDKCFLVNLNADPALNELLVYYLKEHTLIGSADSQDIQLCGMGILPEHCIIDITPEAQVVLTPQKNTRTFVNGSSVSSPVQLHHGDRILWGNNHFFRLHLPKKKTAEREDEEQDPTARNHASSEQLDADGDSSSEVSSEINFNYEYAQMEVTMKALGSNDPMQSILSSLEQQHEEEKRSALERQRLMYEQELEQLRRRLSPEKQNCRGADRLSTPSPSAQQRLRQWAEEREAALNNSLMKLREQIVKANLLVREASYIAEELDKRTEYKVTLQIPASSLDANRKRGSLLSEPAIQVRRKGKGKQIWSLEKLDNRLLDMRDLYQEWKECDEDSPVTRSYFRRADPFYDEQENHSLIGVANVFLETLLYDAKLQYAVPIINQRGEVAGRLHVEVVRVSGDVGDRIAGGDDATEASADKELADKKLVCMLWGLDSEGQAFLDRGMPRPVPALRRVPRPGGGLARLCVRRTNRRPSLPQVKILQATGLPQHLSHFVFCKYSFWDQQEPVVVAPEVDTSSSPMSKEPQCMVVFDHCSRVSLRVERCGLSGDASGNQKLPLRNRLFQEFSVNITEDFTEHLLEGALAIEVYGHKVSDPRRNPAVWDLGIIQAKTRSLRDRWSEVSRKVEFWVQILEQNENGDYCPVEVVPARDVPTGGVFQLRQGQSRRVHVEVKSVQESGALPLIEEGILSVGIGCVRVRPLRPTRAHEAFHEEEEDMDSYQDRDLERLRRKWLTALTKRQDYLDKQLHKSVSKSDKTEDDADREAQLLEMRLTLTEERNAVMVPSAGSGIPGAPAEWYGSLGAAGPARGVREEARVLFSGPRCPEWRCTSPSFSWTSTDNLDDPEPGGWDATLTGEEEDEFFELQIIKEHEGEAKAEASWDSAVHCCPQLSKGTPADERVFLIVRATVQLSHPASMQLVLRKRICVHVHGRQGFAQSLLKKMSHRSSIPGCGVTFEIVSNIPEDAQGAEEREALARMAASVGSTASADSEAHIEKYLRSVLAVENLLTLDRLRQEVAVKEQLTGKGKLSRRSISSPSVNRLSGSRQDLIPSSGLGNNKGRWESQQDVSQPAAARGAAPACPQSRHPSPDVDAGTSPNPVKSLMPQIQMPKLLKSLLPLRDEKKGKQTPPLARQVLSHVLLRWVASRGGRVAWGRRVGEVDGGGPVPRITVHPALPDVGATRVAEAPRASVGPPGAPELTASTTPAARGHDRPARGPPPPPVATALQTPEGPEGPPSPLSEASSGYFSHSVSTATLSDASVPGLDATAQTPGSSPAGLCLVTPEAELPPPIAAREASLERQDQDPAGASPPLPWLPAAPQKASPGWQNGGHAPSGSQQPGHAEEQAEQAGSREPDAGKAPRPLDAPPLPPAAAPTFRVQKVRPSSELKSFSRMLGADPGSPAGTEGAPLASAGPGEGCTEGQALGKLDVSSDSEDAGEVPEWLREGEYVAVGTHKTGIVRYIGPTDFQEGTWIGVELDLPSGKNDGCVGGKQYFRCPPGHGLLVRPGRVRRAGAGGRRRARPLGTPEPRRSSTLSGSAISLASLTAALAKADRSQQNPENRKSWAS
ncbi:Kinesin-like protein KIF13B [Galemys pyrenaicus]|uniref:Kinesin-like protein KIF13B n=1 Tax=Galemys pyrenaicus TaxID=202257 RepID=A0A8J5ZIN6_GALPY|nr:Kinesin-like protein KIF13B [Galemys pyrenaicus]